MTGREEDRSDVRHEPGNEERGNRCIRNASRSAKPPSPALIRREARESSGTPETLIGGVTSVMTSLLECGVHVRTASGRDTQWRRRFARGHWRLLTLALPRNPWVTRDAGQVSEPEDLCPPEAGAGNFTLPPCPANFYRSARAVVEERSPAGQDGVDLAAPTMRCLWERELNGARMNGRVCEPPMPPWNEISSSKAQPSSSCWS